MNIIDLAKQTIVYFEDKESDEVNDYEAPAYDDLPKLEKQVVDFMLLNPNPTDEQIDEFVDSIGIDEDEFDRIVTGLLSKLVKDEYGEQHEDFDEDDEDEES